MHIAFIHVWSQCNIFIIIADYKLALKEFTMVRATLYIYTQAIKNNYLHASA